MVTLEEFGFVMHKSMCLLGSGSSWFWHEFDVFGAKIASNIVILSPLAAAFRPRNLCN
jgi:hypothetical protein